MSTGYDFFKITLFQEKPFFKNMPKWKFVIVSTITFTSIMTVVTFFFYYFSAIHPENHPHWYCLVTEASFIQTCSSSISTANSSAIQATIGPFCPVTPYIH